MPSGFRYALPVFDGSEALAVARAVTDVLEGRLPSGALATVIDRSGSAPQVVGARLLLLEDGRQFGTVGGGAIEAAVLDACREVLLDGRPRRTSSNLARDLGMCCGGTMEVFVEAIVAPARLVIVGGGHVAQALAPLATTVGFRVVVVEDREDMLAREAFAAEPIEVRSYDADELDAAVPDANDRDFVVIVTRDHQRDELALAAAIRGPWRYVGMIGSRRKVHRVLDRVLRRYEERGQPLPDLDRVRAPIGLALGGRTPAEIAVSIVAELIATRRGGHGGAMNVIGDVLRRRGTPLATVTMAEDDGTSLTTPPTGHRIAGGDPSDAHDESAPHEPPPNGRARVGFR